MQLMRGAVSVLGCFCDIFSYLYTGHPIMGHGSSLFFITLIGFSSTFLSAHAPTDSSTVIRIPLLSLLRFLFLL